MSVTPALPDTVGDEEVLARYILFSRWFRSSDNTPKQEAFIPHPYPDLSVTRHFGLSETELWSLGAAVAAAVKNATLYGRADITARSVRSQALQIVPTPEPQNHANILGWPNEKSAQKIVALELAASAKFLPRINV